MKFSMKLSKKKILQKNKHHNCDSLERCKYGTNSNICVCVCYITHIYTMGFYPSGKEPTCQRRRNKRCGFNLWVGKIPWRRAWQLTLVFLPGESHGQRSLVGYSPWGHTESVTTEATQHTAHIYIIYVYTHTHIF